MRILLDSTAYSQLARGHPTVADGIWIAAHTMETGTDLVSSDGHFEHIDGLAWVQVPARDG